MITASLSSLLNARYWSICISMTNEGCHMVSVGVNLLTKPRPWANFAMTLKSCLWVGPYLWMFYHDDIVL